MNSKYRISLITFSIISIILLTGLTSAHYTEYNYDYYYPLNDYGYHNTYNNYYDPGYYNNYQDCGYNLGYNAYPRPYGLAYPAPRGAYNSIYYSNSNIYGYGFNYGYGYNSNDLIANDYLANDYLTNWHLRMYR